MTRGTQPVPTALTIAGSDCSGGAGVQADLKTFAAHGVYGMSVLVSVVAENTSRVISIHDLSPSAIADQMDAVFEDIPPLAVKVGMVSSTSCMDAVAVGLEKWRPAVVVIDPVMYAKGGAPLMAEDAVEHFIDRVMPLASVLTPNIPEAEHLWGRSISTTAQQVEAARAISELMGGGAVLVKGGHAQEQGVFSEDGTPAAEGASVDVLWSEGRATGLSAPRFSTPHTHGTGCTLSSAIAANLALGADVATAVLRAKEYVTGAIAHGMGLGRGHGPTDHFYYLYQHGLARSGPRPDDLPAVEVIDLKELQ